MTATDPGSAALRALAQKAIGLRDGTEPMTSTAGIEFIAAASPDVVLALLDANAAKDAEIARLKAAIREVAQRLDDAKEVDFDMAVLFAIRDLRTALGEEE